jgi:hypothetical protein
VIVVGIALGLALQFVRAWTEPTTAPPNGNVGAPVNTSSIWQTKWGQLFVNADLWTFGQQLVENLGLWVGGKVQADDFCLNSDTAKCLSNSGGGGGEVGAWNYITPKEIYRHDPEGKFGAGKSESENAYKTVSFPTLIPTEGVGALVVKFLSFQQGRYYLTVYAKATNFPEQFVARASSGEHDSSSDTNIIMMPYDNSRQMQIKYKSDREESAAAVAYVIGYVCDGKCSAPEPALYKGDHLVSECTSAGGTVETLSGEKVCHFTFTSPQDDCPSGWSPYNWSAVPAAKTCHGGCTSCTVPAHSWTNIRHTCSYEDGTMFWGLCSGKHTDTCAALATEIACY